MSLRLPNIQRRPLGNLAQKDVSAPLRVANARANALSQWGGAAHAVAGLVKKYRDREDQESLRDAVLSVHEADTQFRSTYGGKSEYDLREINDENLHELMGELDKEGTKDVIPAHQVYAEWRTKNYEAAIKSASLGIRDPDLQKRFVTEQELRRMEDYAEDSIKAEGQQREYITKKSIFETEQYVLKKDYKGAELSIKSAGLDQDVEDRALWQLKYREQTDYFNEVIEKRDLNAMASAYDMLIQNDPKYTSKLNQEEQKQIANQLREGIDQESDGIRSALEGQRKLDRDDLQNLISDKWKGLKTDDVRMQKLIKELQATDPVLAQEAVWTLRFQPEVSKIIRMGPTDRERLYNEVSKLAGPPEHAYFVRQLRSSIDATNAALKTDAVKWGNDTNFLAFAPLDMSSPKAIGASLKARLPGVIALQSRHKVFTGFGNDAEMAALGNLIENASTNEQLAIFGGISKELGEYAAPMYEQLKKNGVSGTAAIAGQLYSTRPEASKMILDGDRILKNNPLIKDQMETSGMKQTIAKKFGLLFAGNRTHQGLMVKAFKNVMAVTQDADKAFRILVGDTITLGEGSVIQAPTPGMTYSQYKRTLESLPDSFWNSPEMRVHGMSPKDLKKGILNGTLKQMGAEMGTSILLTPKNRELARPDGALFKFSLPTDYRIPEFKPRTEYQQGRKKEDLSMGVLPRNPKDIAKDKQKRADEYLKKNPGKTKEDLELQKKQSTPGYTILKGFL